MGSPLSYAAGGASNALEEMLKQKFLEQIQRAKLAEDQRQANMRNVVDTRQLGQGDQRIALDRDKFSEDSRQFGVTAGQRDRTIKLDEEAQPVRLANTRAQTDDIVRKPIAEQQQRDFTSARDKTGHDYQMQEIGAQGANSLRVANVRHPDGVVAGPSQKERNEVADALALIDEIEKDPALAGAVGPMDQYTGHVLTTDPAGVNRFDAKHKQLVGILQLAQGGKLKGQGAVSDAERTMLRAAATALSRGMNETDYKAELGKIRGSFQRSQSQGAPGATPAPAAGNAAKRAADLIKKYGGG